MEASDVTQNFFLNKDSIEFRDGYWFFEWGANLLYRGKKI